MDKYTVTKNIKFTNYLQQSIQAAILARIE